ncbi:hypothetical protein [Saccharolobus shibatae]|uniref:Uncharacterized protein n=1 Tax=Saccharolobus shibatae TaxID=2286 RepID=A0A8F5BV08_9CREN|nr:hypothetical protein [Saccharolobus shibatae]QXJ31925.1 hypothetical protein J5U21_01576 [Saccharolobus shibatae]
MNLLSNYEIVSIIPGILKAKVKDEDLTIRIFVIPLHVFENNGKYSVQVTVITSVDSNNLKFGEICDPQKMMFHEGIAPQDLKLIAKPRLEIKTQDKIIEINLEITNIAVFPDLRDPSGSPCTMISWTIFQTVK